MTISGPPVIIPAGLAKYITIAVTSGFPELTKVWGELLLYFTGLSASLDASCGWKLCVFRIKLTKTHVKSNTNTELHMRKTPFCQRSQVYRFSLISISSELSSLSCPYANPLIFQEKNWKLQDPFQRLSYNWKWRADIQLRLYKSSAQCQCGLLQRGTVLESNKS